MRPAAAALVVLLLPGAFAAQELPLRAWGVRDGLSQSRVNDILVDADGFVWFATWDGLCRYDGRRFVHYGAAEGLPNPLVWCLAESPQGELWLGTHGGGTARVAAAGRALVVDARARATPSEQRVYALAFDAGGRLWRASEAGIARCEDADAAPLADSFGVPWHDGLGRLWFATPAGLLCADASAPALRPWDDAALADDPGELRAAVRDGAGGAWLACARGVFRIAPPADGERARRTSLPLVLEPGDVLYDVCVDGRGRLWIAATRGLGLWDGESARWFGSEQGLPDAWIRSLAADPRGGLWIGTHQSGVAWLADSDVELYGARGGLGDGHAVKLVDCGDGGWLVATEVTGLYELRGGRVERLQGSHAPPFDRVQHQVVRDGAGTWFLGTSQGLFVSPGPGLDLARARPVEAPSRLAGQGVTWLGLDPVGRATVGTEGGEVFVTLDHGASFARAPFDLAGRAVRGLAWTPDGSVWVSDGQALGRVRGARVEPVSVGDAPEPELLPRELLVDSRGWLWIGTRFGGVAWTRDPSLETPAFERLRAEDGLASDVVYALAEDARGALFIGTGRGIQRFDPHVAGLELVGADGVPTEWIVDLALDARGDLWCASGQGVARLPSPSARRPAPPAPVRFTRCIAGGDELELPGRGALALPELRMAAARSDLWLEYVAVDPVRGAELVYQTRLEGLDTQWSAPTRDLSLRFGSLPAGSYRLQVRSLAPGAERASEPASLPLVVTPPAWQRPWAIALALSLCAMAGWLAQRARSRRARALDRLRLSIAADLHDDLGAGLAGIAVTSEVARGCEPEAARARMGEVAQIARDLRGSMGDLVWAVDPRHDSLADAVERMRQHGAELVSAPGQTLEFSAPEREALEPVRMPPDRRRQLVLFHKEAVANVARHAGATCVRVTLRLAGGRLALSVEDDGSGFDPERVVEGRGLGHLRRRARELGGRLELVSSPGGGTRVALDAPLAARRSAP